METIKTKSVIGKDRRLRIDMEVSLPPGPVEVVMVVSPEPPVLSDNNSIVKEHLRLIDLIRDPPEILGITGGEPTLLGVGLVQVLARLLERFPETHIHMLTNGRLYAYVDLVRALAEVGHPHFLSAIPLYSDIAPEHDYIVQARGAFDETLRGFYNTAKK